MQSVPLRAFISAGLHPNVYGALVVSLGCQWTKPEDVVRPIQEAGRECHHLCIQEDGGFARWWKRASSWSNRCRRTQPSRKKCPARFGPHHRGYNGGSDWTSGVSGNPVIGEALDWHDANGGMLVHMPAGAASPNLPLPTRWPSSWWRKPVSLTRIVAAAPEWAIRGEPSPGNKAAGSLLSGEEPGITYDCRTCQNS